MTIVVMNAAGEVEQQTTGKTPDRPEIVADNERRQAKTESKTEAKKEPEKKAGPKVEPESKQETKTDEVISKKDTDWATRLGLTEDQKKELQQVINRAVSKQHGQRKEAEEFAAEQYNELKLAEKRAESLQRELERMKAVNAPKQETPAEAKKPDRSEFKTDEEYQEALVDYRVEAKLAKQREEDAKRQREAEQAKVLETAKERIEKAIELVPDFEEVTSAVDLEVPPYIAGYMQESDLFAELGYYLAKNTDVVKKLQTLPPARALVEIGKIESKLQPFSQEKVETKESNGAKPGNADASPSSKPRAQSAPVIQPIAVNSDSQVEKPESKMNYAEAKAHWERTHKRSLSSRQRH